MGAKRDKTAVQTTTATHDGFAITFYWRDGAIERTEFGLAGKGRRSSAQASEKEREWLRAFLSGEMPSGLPLNWDSLTEFQRRVLEILCTVPAGRTITYGELARRAGRPGAARAIGQVMRRNPFAPFVPCHRIVAEDGLGGYGGREHSEVKTRLLVHETFRQQ